jgi:hypothetical protein
VFGRGSRRAVTRLSISGWQPGAGPLPVAWIVALRLLCLKQSMLKSAALLLVFLLVPAGWVEAQAPAEETPQIDVFDLARKIWSKAPPVEQAWDYTKPMRAFAPVIGAKPSAGALFGVAGNLAFYRGDPATTHISSVVTSLTFSTKGQTSFTDRFTIFTRDDRWRLDADHRIQWTSLNTYDLGTSADTSSGVNTKFDFLRLHHTAFYRLRPSLFVGTGLYFDNHYDVEPKDLDENDDEWTGSPYLQYSIANRLPLQAQAAAGPSVDLMWDSRDNFINPQRGWLGRASYRMLLDDFLGGDSSWQKLNLDLRGYRPVSKSKRHAVAVWLFTDQVVDGTAPFFDLPGTGLDTYGRSARGYSEGQFRGEKLAYGEIEYRGLLMKNGLLGMVAFINTTTVSNEAAGEKMFDSFATGGGAGLRLSINKRSKTNLCFDVAFGKQGSRGVYLAVQEAF